MTCIGESYSEINYDHIFGTQNRNQLKNLQYSSWRSTYEPWSSSGPYVDELEFFHPNLESYYYIEIKGKISKSLSSIIISNEIPCNQFCFAN